MKLKELLDSMPAINKLISKEIPAAVAYELAVFLNKANDEVKAFYQIRDQKVKEASEGGSMSEEKQSELQKELAVLVDKEIDLQVPVLRLSDLGEINVSSADMISLLWLIQK